MADLLVIVPSRGRPHNIRAVVRAWEVTGAFADADLAIAFDTDDPARDGYAEVLAESAELGVSGIEFPEWKPMVPKLNEAAVSEQNNYEALAFMGDDHIPRTEDWAWRYVQTLRGLQTGIVYSNDAIQGKKLPTQWAMTSDIVKSLGRMVPAPVEHLYCDNAILDLGRAAGCISYLPDVLIEHVHPIAKKAPVDPGYLRVNAPEQYERDRAAYMLWRQNQLPADVEAVLTLRQEAEHG